MAVVLASATRKARSPSGISHCSLSLSPSLAGRTSNVRHLAIKSRKVGVHELPSSASGLPSVAVMNMARIEDDFSGIFRLAIWTRHTPSQSNRINQSIFCGEQAAKSIHQVHIARDESLQEPSRTMIQPSFRSDWSCVTSLHRGRNRLYKPTPTPTPVRFECAISCSIARGFTDTYSA